MLTIALAAVTALGALSGTEGQGYDRALRVVYFNPSDREPEPNYRDRLDRVMTDIQGFYAQGMAARGYGPMTFPLERDEEGRLVIYEVLGAQPAAHYTSPNGHELRGEVAAHLAGIGLDADRETLIIFENLVVTEGDRLSGNTPYYGGGDHRSGTAWVTDYPTLDPLNLPATEPTMYDNGRPYSLGRYNTVYIGGAAHELGHALGLPHVRATAAESVMGTTLMGSGNYTYREEIRGEGKGTFLSAASAAVLANHPLFRRSDEGKDDAVTCDLTDVRGEPTAGGMVVRGNVATNVAPRAVIAFADPDGGSDYDAYSWVAPVDSAGRFSVPVTGLAPGGHELRLTFCYPAGQTRTFGVPFAVDEQGRPDHRVLHLGHLQRQAAAAVRRGDLDAARDLADTAVARFERLPDPLRTDGQRSVARKAASLVDVATTEPASDPVDAPADLPDAVMAAFLSDLVWESAEVGWERPCRDRIPSGSSRELLESGERYHSHGIYAHAASRYAFRLGGKWSALRTAYGLQQGAQGSVVFVVMGDGEELFRSDLVRDFVERTVEVDLAGVELLELICEEGDGSNYADCSVWFSPELVR